MLRRIRIIQKTIQKSVSSMRTVALRISFIAKRKVKTLPKTLWILFTTGFPVMVLNVLIMVYAPHLEAVMNVVCGYLVPLILSHRLIRYQEELNETINRKEK